MKKSIAYIFIALAVFAGDAASQTRRTTVRRVVRKTAPTRKIVVIKKMTTNTNKSAAMTTASGLTYIVTEHGAGAQLKAGDTIVVNYTGLLTNGVKFDSSLDRNQPFSFELGAGKVIKGWDEGFAKLRIGDRATLIIPAALGYGARGAGDDIPPNATLIFIVEVLGVK